MQWLYREENGYTISEATMITPCKCGGKPLVHIRYDKAGFVKCNRCCLRTALMDYPDAALQVWNEEIVKWEDK